MSKPRGIMVTERSNKDLRLVFEAPESFAVDNTVAVTLEGGAYRARIFVSRPTRR